MTLLIYKTTVYFTTYTMLVLSTSPLISRGEDVRASPGYSIIRHPGLNQVAPSSKATITSERALAERHYSRRFESGYRGRGRRDLLYRTLVESTTSITP